MNILKNISKFLKQKKNPNKYSKFKIFLLICVSLYAYNSAFNYFNKPVYVYGNEETVNFSVKGNYVDGKDFKAGTYYAVNTKNNDNKTSSVVIYHNGNQIDSIFLKFGQIKKITIPKGAEIKVSSDSDNFEITLFTQHDFKSQKIEEKYSQKENNSVAHSNSNNSTQSPNSSTESSTESSTATTITSTESVSSESNSNSVRISDSEIESIQTYNDYITVYGKIVNAYLENYKNKMNEYTVVDETVFQSIKSGVEQGLNDQKKSFGKMGTKKIIGKENMVQYLKSYRDQLQSYVDNIGK